MHSPAATAQSLSPLAEGEASRVAEQLAVHHAPTKDQLARIAEIRAQTERLLRAIIVTGAPSPERSTAIAKAREAMMWANAGIIFGPDTLTV